MPIIGESNDSGKKNERLPLEGKLREAVMRCFPHLGHTASVSALPIRLPLKGKAFLNPSKNEAAVKIVRNMSSRGALATKDLLKNADTIYAFDKILRLRLRMTGLS